MHRVWSVNYANSLPCFFFFFFQEHGSSPAETPDMIVFLFLLYTLIPAIGIMISCTNTFFSFTPPILVVKPWHSQATVDRPLIPRPPAFCLATSRHLPTSHQHHYLSRLSRPIYLPNFSRKSLPLNSQPLGDRLNYPLAGRGANRNRKSYRDGMSAEHRQDRRRRRLRLGFGFGFGFGFGASRGKWSLR